ncbi:ATP-binding protein [Caulobacter sp. UNC279MFTsu5.1]|uniref:ATP-binding protein n=1 Tax=Caulobacter sp. UNC279MFTsu5.1 TaxID=1502775 RepID=UPI00036EE931|nr:ATP-binding protein [Caulobacter sp. UNC279MFTsu5.1]SFJ62441.1 Signal transduction histidine kinase [Caulobacter sp. UNC279MFTsu5.1]
MRVAWDELAAAYRPAAISHRRQIPLRLFVILVIVVVMAWRPALSFLAPWAAACIAAQIAEQQALRYFLARAEPGRAVALTLATDVLLAVVFGWAALPIWAMGTPVATASAVVLVSGSVLTALMGAEGCVAAFVAAATPHMTYMFILPLTAATRHDPLAPYYLVGVALFTLVLGLVFAWSRRTFEAERSARRLAEAQTAAKSAFVAMVSHELRTPLSAILGGAGDLAREAGDARARDKAALIADAGAMMRSLLNDLLDFSKIEAGRMSVEILDFAPGPLIGETVRFWRDEAEAKGLTLDLTGERDLPDWLRGDPVRIRQVLNNLLSNAIKFTPLGQVAVSVSAEQWADAWRLAVEVSDTGPGLSPDQMARLFTAYDQLGPDTARTFGGTGLGLSISRDLARLMGGDLTVRSPPQGGAIFQLVLPMTTGAAPVVAEPLLAPLSAPLGAFDRSPMALVVDDHEVNRRLLSHILDALGVRVELASDGEAGLVLAGERHFDVILMDVNMPGLDGLEATRRLRAQGPNSATPVIAVTAGVSDAERAACRAAGMDDWVEKPFQAATLRQVLSRVLDPVRA